jgi:hypothetical protein
MVLSVGRLKGEMFNIRCGGDAHVEIGVGHTRKDRVQNDDIRDRVRVALIAEKLVQHRLR